MSTTVTVRVTTRARRDEIAVWRGDVLLVRVKAPPVEGKANEAVLKLLAGALQVRVGQLELAAGERSRDKRIEIDG